MADKNTIQGYIERSIPDIARKCGCTNGEVMMQMLEYLDSQCKPKEKWV